MAALASMRGGTMDGALARAPLTGGGARTARATRKALPRRCTSSACTSAGRMGTRATCSRSGARIAREIGNLGLEAACIGWLGIDAFWYDTSVDDGLELVARVLDRPNMGSEASRLLIIGGNFKRMGGREEEGLADIEEGTKRLFEFGRMVDAHAMAMATACVSLLAGRSDEAERAAHARVRSPQGVRRSGIFLDRDARLAGVAPRESGSLRRGGASGRRGQRGRRGGRCVDPGVLARRQGADPRRAWRLRRAPTKCLEESLEVLDSPSPLRPSAPQYQRRPKSIELAGQAGRSETSADEALAGSKGEGRSSSATTGSRSCRPSSRGRTRGR